jgi:2-polyprenyl-3-methyl-5-hydroxy-6-metoxy-1,4-benzoquinol methylase
VAFQDDRLRLDHGAIIKPVDREKSKAALDRVFRDMAGAMTAGMALVGTRTGLFRAMKSRGAMRADDVVRTAKLERRYVEEWLKGMAAAGYLDYDPAKETYALPDEVAYFVASEGTDHFVGGMWEMVPPLLRQAPKVADAFSRGGGVPFEEFGADCVHALDLINRGQYEARFVDYWLQSLPAVVDKLRKGGKALDFGCGSGRVCIALAKAFPHAAIHGVDVDAASIARAREAAKRDGVRVAFHVGEPPSGPFDLLTLCDSLHDLAHPLAALKQMRERLAEDGTLFIIEPKAADRLEDNRNPVATMFYGFSLFHCMTQSLARGGPGLGTCLGPAATEQLVREAGFAQFHRLDIKSLTNLFYAARK